MIVIKFLERKDVIRWFGIALILAPFFNKVISVSMLTNVTNPFNFNLIAAAFASESLFDHTLSFASLIIGLLMLQGSSKAWRYVLILLGGYLAQQTMHLGHDIKGHWFVGAIYLLNLAVFIFIADQLVWKINLPTRAASWKNSSSNKKIFIHFDGIGPWAQLVAISSEGLQVRSLRAPPPGIESKEIEIYLSNGLKLQIRLLRQSEDNFFFSYINIASAEIQLLNQWLQKQAA